MTRNEIIRRYPNASEAFIKRNLSEAGHQLSDAKLERDKAATLDGAILGKEKSAGRTRVRFTGYRIRPLDPDNFAAGTKDLLDGLRHAGLLQGDEPWRITLETEQVKVAHRDEQGTVIEIFYPSV
jgi:hypothetical protein